MQDSSTKWQKRDSSGRNILKIWFYQFALGYDCDAQLPNRPGLLYAKYIFLSNLEIASIDISFNFKTPRVFMLHKKMASSFIIGRGINLVNIVLAILSFVTYLKNDKLIANKYNYVHNFICCVILHFHEQFSTCWRSYSMEDVCGRSDNFLFADIKNCLPSCTELITRGQYTYRSHGK